MPSNPNNSSPFPPSSPFDHLLIQTLMSRLDLQTPFSNPAHLHDFLLQEHADDTEEDCNDDEGVDSGERRRRRVAREERRLEREIIRIVRSGSAAATEALKPNSGQSVTVGEHSVCVGFHVDSQGEYRVWEWHGHVMLFDEEDGFSAEYIYGNHFERLPEKEVEKDEDGSSRDSGLRGLIMDAKGSIGGQDGRVLHRNSFNSGAASR